MKKLFITLFLLAFCVSISGAGIVDKLKSVIARKNAVCVKDTGTLIYDYTAGSDGFQLGSSTQAAGEDFIYGSAFKLYSIKLYFDWVTDCEVTVRIGATNDLTTVYMEEWANVTVNSGGPADASYEFISVDQDTFSASTTYSIGVIETSGTCALQYGTSNPVATNDMIYDDAGTTGWVMDYSYTDNRDINMELFRCAP